ncbi:MAG: response regulator transcription factor [Geobacteraceae bacterium]|nr:response regulator transcription factor [Geobacteraceae bacterium]
MKVIICDDQATIRDGLQMLLALDKEIEVVGLAEEGWEAVELTARLKPDLVLMDLKMTGMNGIEATRRIRTGFPAVKVLVLTTYDDDDWVMGAIRAGASGYLLKDTPREQLIRAVKETVAGKTFVDPAVAGNLMNKLSAGQTGPAVLITEKLSERELDVLRLLARGLNNAQIADRLFLSQGTIRNYVSSIFSKLDVSDRTQAAVVAIQHGLGTG